MDDDTAGDRADRGDAWGDTGEYEAMGASDLAEAYVAFLVDSRGDRAARLRAEANIGVYDEVCSRLQHGPDPITLIDAIVRCAPPVEVVWVLGAGVMEDFLQWRPEYWELVDDRCSDSVDWAQMMSGAWLPDSVREQMPTRLRALFPLALVPEEESHRSRRAREKAERKARTRKSWNGRTAPRGALMREPVGPTSTCSSPRGAVIGELLGGLVEDASSSSSQGSEEEC